MTNFLPAGVINDSIDEIFEIVSKLKNEHDIRLLKNGLNEIEEIVLELTVFLGKLSCQPLIYTGHGNTDEVIKRLEWALTFSEGINPIEYFSYSKGGKKRSTK